ncbi:MAG TPA: hypothetical protein VE109_06785, partial [Acidobacteriaceae bacterium]|nr:hypothetical protein [Acidobacteriaceae bacterium]
KLSAAPTNFQGGSVLSVQTTTERYLGCKQRRRNAANDTKGSRYGCPSSLRSPSATLLTV